MYEHERSLVKTLKDKPFVLLGVNSDKDREDVKKVVKQEKITWRSFWNGGGTDGPIAKTWGVAAWPTIFLIDARGIIRYKFVGGDGLDEALAKLMRNAEREVVKKPAGKPSDHPASESPSTVAKGDPNRQDKLAETKLTFAKTLLDDGKTERARQRLHEIVRQYPKTPAAREAQELLDKLK
jgi:hypothetical protein